ncbi:MAG: hypothetical protein GY940_39100 [bacterium]|nr:hypothetical protein [bacterium]
MKRIAAAMIMLTLITASLTGAGTKKDKTGKNKTQENKINIVASLGLSGSGFLDEVLIDLGVEFKLAGPLYVQIVANSHLDDDRRYGGYYDPFYSPYYYGGRNVSVGLSANALHGVSSYGVLKTNLSRKVILFGKAGVHAMFYSKYDYSASFDYLTKRSTNGFGFAGGAGMEFTLGKRAAVTLGTTYKVLFDRRSDWHPDQSRINWFKFYAGGYYRVK